VRQATQVARAPRMPQLREKVLERSLEVGMAVHGAVQHTRQGKPLLARIVATRMPGAYLSLQSPGVHGPAPAALDPRHLVARSPRARTSGRAPRSRAASSRPPRSRPTRARADRTMRRPITCRRRGARAVRRAARAACAQVSSGTLRAFAARRPARSLLADRAVRARLARPCSCRALRVRARSSVRSAPALRARSGAAISRPRRVQAPSNQPS